jgi:hypothetical protein
LPGIKFVNINFWYNRCRAWPGSGLVTKVVHDQFLIGRVEPKTRRKLVIDGFSLHFFLLKKDRWCLKRKTEAWGSLLIRLKRPHDEDLAKVGREERGGLERNEGV